MAVFALLIASSERTFRGLGTETIRSTPNTPSHSPKGHSGASELKLIPLKGSLHRYKYRLYFGKDGTCLVRYDNEHSKGDHKHVAGLEEPYRFKDVNTLLDNFWEDVERTGDD